MRSSATTKPLPERLLPHWYAVPVIRTTDAAARASWASSTPPDGSSGASVGASSTSTSQGMPSPSAAVRSWARRVRVGAGVIWSRVVSTRDPATAGESTGTPIAETPDADEGDHEGGDQQVADRSEDAVEHAELHGTLRHG